jgi:hypothetical protein
MHFVENEIESSNLNTEVRRSEKRVDNVELSPILFALFHNCINDLVSERNVVFVKEGLVELSFSIWDRIKVFLEDFGD